MAIRACASAPTPYARAIAVPAIDLVQAVRRRTDLAALAAVAAVAYVARAYPRDPWTLKNRVYASVALVVAITAAPLVIAASLASAFLYFRVAGLGIDISLADVVLTVAMVAALRFVVPVSPRTRRLFVVIAMFQALGLLVVAAHPTRAAMFEWAHRMVLVAGAVLVGLALHRTAVLRVALWLYLAAASAFALEALRFTVLHDFAHAYPFGLQKNPAGLLMAFGLLVVFVAPRALQLPLGTRGPLVVVLSLGLVATRSRGSMLALIVALFLWSAREGKTRRTFVLAAVAVIGMGSVVFVTTESELEYVRANPDAQRFRPIGSRVESTSLAIEQFRTQPVVGGGIRYFRQRGEVEAHNVIVLTAAEGGLVGLTALAVLLGGTYVALRGLPGQLGRLARLAILMRLVAGLLDIYWVAGTGSLPWLFVGLALADETARARPPAAGSVEPAVTPGA